jgi:hypothetical protein
LTLHATMVSLICHLFHYTHLLTLLQMSLGSASPRQQAHAALFQIPYFLRPSFPSSLSNVRSVSSSRVESTLNLVYLPELAACLNAPRSRARRINFACV